MKYCKNCGKELFDEAVICPLCKTEQKVINDINTSNNNSLSVQNRTPHLTISKDKKKKIKNTMLKIFIPIITIVILVLGVICGYEVYSAVYINKNIDTWISEIADGNLTTAEQWDTLEEEVNKCDPYYISKYGLYEFTTIGRKLCNNYSTYKFVQENIKILSDINICYNDFANNRINNNTLSYYNSICKTFTGEAYEDGGSDNYEDAMIDEWNKNPYLKPYCEKYLKMKPTHENLTGSYNIYPDSNEITATITNNNVFPVSNYRLELSFTIVYFTEYGLEYYRGTKTIYKDSEDDTLNGKGSSIDMTKDNEDSSKNSVDISESFNADEYYDGYATYYGCEVWDSQMTIVLVE